MGERGVVDGSKNTEYFVVHGRAEYVDCWAIVSFI